ncbi:TPA: glycerophosphodiester phosphodiesterase [Staphylococcus delphini]|nr:glycerophosphodiester phosphodiesterase [Staphylococcus delphini]HEC2169204.1 glycerophosphodiester phosphodiesterase [Staphylococcus delphini]HEC2179681.1 glycerophosphodiester phosphodiesterase [Staphylococcus delphini]HEC2184233.1 glycerophosphodiester phosphodiesterase [Staphylococcus delphini]HEC2194688.1 glycerophosphodiester phosphodiesterase [Staphylococcus delphini]
MTRKSQILKGALWCVTSVVTGALLLQKTTKAPKPRAIPPFFSGPAPYIFSHRGGMGERPESTALAFDYSVQMQLTGFETDIRISKDEQVIVFHDAEVDRTTNGSGPVSAHTLDALKALDAGYHFKDINGERPYQNHPDAKILTMGELLARYPEQLVNIDIKDHPDSYEGQIAAQRLYDVIVQHQAESRVLVTSFYREQIERFHQISQGTVAIGASQAEVTEGILKLYTGLKHFYHGKAQTFQMPTHFHGIPLVQPKLIQWLNNTNRMPGYYGVNSVDSMHHLVALGVHTIVTDRPSLGRQFLTVYRQRQS